MGFYSFFSARNVCLPLCNREINNTFPAIGINFVLIAFYINLRVIIIVIYLWHLKTYHN